MNKKLAELKKLIFKTHLTARALENISLALQRGNNSDEFLLKRRESQMKATYAKNIQDLLLQFEAYRAQAIRNKDVIVLELERIYKSVINISKYMRK